MKKYFKVNSANILIIIKKQKFNVFQFYTCQDLPFSRMAVFIILNYFPSTKGPSFQPPVPPMTPTTEPAPASIR